MATYQDMNRNPTGSGGFVDHPEHRNPGGWKKEDSIPYQMNFLIRMTLEDLETWARDNKKTMTMAQAIAYKRVVAALDSLPDQKEVTDRTSGKAKETIEQTIIEKPIPLEDLDFELR
jgi:hypothetical protein